MEMNLPPYHITDPEVGQLAYSSSQMVIGVITAIDEKNTYVSLLPRLAGSLPVACHLDDLFLLPDGSTILEPKGNPPERTGWMSLPTEEVERLYHLQFVVSEFVEVLKYKSFQRGIALTSVESFAFEELGPLLVTPEEGKE